MSRTCSPLVGSNALMAASPRASIWRSRTRETALQVQFATSRLLKFGILSMAATTTGELMAVAGVVSAALNGVLRHFRHSRHTDAAAGRSFGMRIRLYAAAVRTKNHSTKSRPRCRVFRKPPIVLIQPKGSSIRFRLIMLMA